MDSLCKYKMSNEERERVLMKTLRRIARSRLEPSFYARRKNLGTWERIDQTYGRGCSDDAVRALAELSLIETDDGSKRYKASKRGKEYLKRGYINLRKDNAARNANIIATCAIIVATLLNPQFWKVLKWAWEAIVGTIGIQ